MDHSDRCRRTRRSHSASYPAHLVAVELSIRGTFTGTFDSPAGVIKGNRAKLDVPGADFWYVENGKIKEFNCYVNVNVMLEQMGIQPDFASAVRAKRP
jgi:hypothetical protein